MADYNGRATTVKLRDFGHHKPHTFTNLDHGCEGVPVTKTNRLNL